MNVRNQLQSLGFYAPIEAFEVLKRQAQTMAILAGTDSPELKFEAFASYIPARRAKYPHNSQLVIDVGGTSTKTGLRVCDNSGFEHWHILFELKNDELRYSEDHELPLESFAFHLGEHLVEHLKRMKVPRDNISTCAIVWSNAMLNRLLSDNRGITGSVVQRERYTKGEWFIEGLENGSDLGQIFLKGFERNGITIGTFLIANDTPLTMKALPEAHGGVVASTGLNGTLVKSYAELGIEDRSDATVICNAEMGGRFFIDESLLSRADKIGTNQPAHTLEFLTAGRFLPCLFTEHIMQLADNGLDCLKPLHADLVARGENRWSAFRSKDMGLLLSDRSEFLKRRTSPDLFTPENIDILSQLASEIFIRAGTLCAVIAYGTIANRIDSLDKPIVALDSRLAREVPSFKEAFTKSIRTMSEALAKPITSPIVLPLDVEGGKISVPMQGAAHALDCLT